MVMYKRASNRRKIDYFNASNMYVQNIICDYCGREHAYSKLPTDNLFYSSYEQTNFVGDFYKPPNNPYFNIYYLEWWNQPTFPEFQPQEKKTDLKDLLRSYITSTEHLRKENEVVNKNLKASIGNLEAQLGHLRKMLLK